MLSPAQERQRKNNNNKKESKHFSPKSVEEVTKHVFMQMLKKSHKFKIANSFSIWVCGYCII